MIAVQQCMRNAISKNRKYLCRELFTFVKPRLTNIVIYNSRPLECPSYKKLWRTDILLKRQIFFTGCSSFSSCDIKSNNVVTSQKPAENEKKLSLLQKFKQMYKQYWYVLVPVHMITSCIWFGSFYYVAESGINVLELLESFGAPDSWIDKIRESKAGNVVVAATLYKLATPFRYMVTIGGTTVAINYLKKWEWIKPVPNKEQIKKMYQEQKGAFKDFTSSYQGKMLQKKDDILKTKEDLKQQYMEVRDGLNKSVDESKRDFKEGVKVAASEWKHIGGLIKRDIKKAVKTMSSKD